MFSVIAVTIVLIFGAIVAFVIFGGNGDGEKGEKQVKTEDPKGSKIGKFGEDRDLNTKKTTVTGSKEKDDEDENSDIVSAIKPEKKKKEVHKTVTKKLDDERNQVSMETGNGNSISVAVDNGKNRSSVDSKGNISVTTDKSGNVEVNGKDVKTIKKTKDPYESLRQNKVSNKVKDIYKKHGVRVAGSSDGGMFTLGDIDHAYETKGGEYLLINDPDNDESVQVAIEVAQRLGMKSSADDVKKAIKETFKTEVQVDVGKTYVRFDGDTLSIGW